MLYRNDNKFVVKLPFSTNSTRLKYVVGMEGILRALGEFMGNSKVFGYIHYALIQPEIIDNAEVKIVCFDGVPKFKNIIKKGKSNRSPFNRMPKATFFAFAEHVIATLKQVCPSINTRQVLRIDIFGFRTAPGKFIVNEIEGYEAHKTGAGVTGCDEAGAIMDRLEQYWFEMIRDLVDYHVNIVLNRLYGSTSTTATVT